MKASVRKFVREKKVYCGKDILEVDIYAYTDNQQKAVKRKRGVRGKVQYISPPKQKNLNDKRAKRYFVQLANSNFGTGDLAVHLTYAPENLPATFEEAQKQAVKYLRRVAYRRERLGLPPLRYLLVTQKGRKVNGSHRFHHHILMNGGLNRDEVETMWTTQRVNWQKYHADPEYRNNVRLIGWANADRLRESEKGIAEMSGYIIQDTAGKRHWTQSQNLKKPRTYGPPNDDKYSFRQLHKAAEMQPESDDFRRYWESKYRGWKLVGAVREYNDVTGWCFYLTLRRRN